MQIVKFSFIIFLISIITFSGVFPGDPLSKKSEHLYENIYIAGDSLYEFCDEKWKKNWMYWNEIWINILHQDRQEKKDSNSKDNKTIQEKDSNFTKSEMPIKIYINIGVMDGTFDWFKCQIKKKALSYCSGLYHNLKKKLEKENRQLKKKREKEDRQLLEIMRLQELKNFFK